MRKLDSKGFDTQILLYRRKEKKFIKKRTPSQNCFQSTFNPNVFRQFKNNSINSSINNQQSASLNETEAKVVNTIKKPIIRRRISSSSIHKRFPSDFFQLQLPKTKITLQQQKDKQNIETPKFKKQSKLEQYINSYQKPQYEKKKNQLNNRNNQFSQPNIKNTSPVYLIRRIINPSTSKKNKYRFKSMSNDLGYIYDKLL